jgi:hypothetical protein
VGDPGWNGSQLVEGFGVTKLQDRSQARLVDLLNTTCESSAMVLLHYSGYGYATRGCPAWLVNGLEQWRNETSNRTLITMFHELYASGPPWTSAFWLSPLQRSLAARLARLSDQYLTSRQYYAEMVCKWSLGKHKDVFSLPVFSSIGEPRTAAPLIERSQRLVVFGTLGRRIQVYKRSAEDLNQICHKLGINEILDIGRPLELNLSQIMRVPVTVCGELSRKEVSSIFSDAIAGVIDYPAEVLGKSTIFAAYCAHRMIPIVATYGKASRADGLEADTHYWLSDAQPKALSLDAGQVIADNAYTWYQTHNLSIHAKTLATCLQGGNFTREGNTIGARI